MAVFDFIVIGAGMAGASVAAELSKAYDVLMVEAEERAGFHSTGRSGAIFGEVYGNPVLRRLCQASQAFLFSPSTDFTPHPLVKPRGALLVANAGQQKAMAAFAKQPEVQARARLLDGDAARAICPLLRADYVVSGVFDPTVSDIDVDGLHQAYLRLFHRTGGWFMPSCRVDAIARNTALWNVRSGSETYSAPVVINAAGAWADQVAAVASVAPIGLHVFRRTALLVEAPAGVDLDSLPLVLDPDEQFYFKPDAGLLLLSPADETPVEPGDAQPDEMDIAIAVDRVMRAADIPVRSIRHRWAGLRSFAADRVPVVGFDPCAPGFFWLVGQGGHGIATAAALSRIAAALAVGRPIPEDVTSFGIDAEALSPLRLRSESAAATILMHGY